MYQAIYCDKKSSTVHLWDDKNGYTSFKYRPYAYRKKHGGRYLSIYGEALEKTDRFHPAEPNLYESDVPWDTRVLIDAYAESDDVSTNHRTVILDIEVESKDGYPNYENPKQKVTAIALYEATKSHYYCYVLDEEGLVKAGTEKDKIGRAHV